MSNETEPGEWNALVSSVCAQMRDRIRSYVTPLALSEEPESGEALGTGNYLRWNADLVIVTNEHVARATERGSVTHQPNVGDYFHRCGTFGAIGEPEDVAVAIVYGAMRSADNAIELGMIDENVRPRPR
jgi:hypothetical protein